MTDRIDWLFRLHRSSVLANAISNQKCVELDGVKPDIGIKLRGPVMNFKLKSCRIINFILFNRLDTILIYLGSVMITPCISTELCESKSFKCKLIKNSEGKMVIVFWHFLHLNVKIVFIFIVIVEKGFVNHSN